MEVSNSPPAANIPAKGFAFEFAGKNNPIAKLKTAIEVEL
jgi:hypothetical protein